MESYFSNLLADMGVSRHSEEPSPRVKGHKDGEKAKKGLMHGSLMFLLVYLEIA